MLIRADARAIPLADERVDCVVTSPPYWGLRDYGTARWEGGSAGCDHRHQLGGEGQASAKQNTSAGMQSVGYRGTCGKCGARRIDAQLGLESTPEEYVAAMVDAFRGVRRVLKPRGVLWLNLGDSYATAGGSGYQGKNGQRADRRFTQESLRHRPTEASGLKPKDLVGIPWRVAFALQADGWWLRSDVIWHKPNPTPESVTDRPTKAHEYVFLLTKSERYYYDAVSIAEPARHAGRLLDYTGDQKANTADELRQRTLPRGRVREVGPSRNARSVWTITTQPYPGAHFATFPPELARRCILSGCPAGGLVLDPFVGSGTVVKVARELGREGIGLDINQSYLSEQATKRIKVNRGLPLVMESV